VPLGAPHFKASALAANQVEVFWPAVVCIIVRLTLIAILCSWPTMSHPGSLVVVGSY
jgi:hypothetical protein